MNKQKRFLLVIPLLVLPFLTMAFWALGGGKDEPATKAINVKGLDTSLPQAQFKDNKPANKMDVYQQAKRDSSGHNDGGLSRSFAQAMGLTGRHDSINRPSPQTADASAAKIQEKLAAINRQISQPQTATAYSPAEQPDEREEIKLNRMMRTMNRSQASDPEMSQLNNMLTKIQAIQHPELVKKPKKKTGADTAFKAIPAVIDGRQKVVNGAVVRLKLIDSVSIKGVMLPKGQELNGECQVINQRLLLDIKSVHVGKDIILPVNLTVYSPDGLPGIPAPEAELAGAAGGGADNAVSNMQFMSMDQSLGAQAAAGGINAAKGLFSKKVRAIKVKLKSGRPVLLKDNDRKK